MVSMNDEQGLSGCYQGSAPRQPIDALVAGITKIANHDTIVRRLEPNVLFPKVIGERETLRILYALSLYHGEYETWLGEQGISSSEGR